MQYKEKTVRDIVIDTEEIASEGGRKVNVDFSFVIRLFGFLG